MSLIFEALKKLEREKEAPDRGLVVVAPGAWGEREPRPLGRTLAAVSLVALGLGLAVFALRPRARAPESAAPKAAAAPRVPPAVIAIPFSEPARSGRADGDPPPPPRLVLPTAAPPRGAPTAPAATSEPEPRPELPAADPAFRLNAISTRDGHPVALLNDRLVREGDVIGDVRVLRIGEDYVEVEVKGERRVIRF